jgi:hypothetical protein
LRPFKEKKWKIYIFGTLCKNKTFVYRC